MPVTKKGYILKTSGNKYLIDNKDGDPFLCTLKGTFRLNDISSTNPVSVGDIVTIQLENEKEGVIVEIEKRKNYIIRKSINLSRSSHILASNIDRLYIIVSVYKPRTSSGFIDRIAITAEAYHIPIGIIINKIDIYNNEAKQRCAELKSIYEKIGYNVYLTSAKTCEGIDELKDALFNKINLFIGHSGVGKSALLNALNPKLNIRTQEVSKYHQTGRHTTTFSEMHLIQDETYIIDTPGVKEFGLFNFQEDEVWERYPEFRKYSKNCRFNNCTHTNEPECAVIKQMKEGNISAERYKNYINIFNKRV